MDIRNNRMFRGIHSIPIPYWAKEAVIWLISTLMAWRSIYKLPKELGKISMEMIM